MIRVRAFPAASGPLDLDVARGELVLLRGANGSGKTSLLRALAGLDGALAPASIEVDGADPRNLPAATLASRVALSPQAARDALAGLTVEGEMRLRSRAAPTALAPLLARESATLSSGEARFVALTLAEGDAPLLLLDEPAEGLDAQGRARLLRLVERARARGCAVVAADHAGVLDGLATRVVDLGHVAPPGTTRRHLAPPGRVVLHAPAATARGLRFPALSLPAGLHALAGPNGSGKSTRLLQLAGLLPGGPGLEPGIDVRLALPDARATFTRDTVADELRAAERSVVEALVPTALLARHPLALSGGEAQRVNLAKAMGRAASVYLLDEPEAHLDAVGRAALLDVVGRRVEEGACVLVATHDEAILWLAQTIARLEASG